MRERFGEYELLKLIATGGMAEIYLAELAGAEGFSRRLVVKKMLPQLAVRQDFVSMFLDEARLAANLVHPNIVQVFNLGEVEGAYFMAMELVDGPHLGALFAHSLRQRKPLPLELCVFAVARAADGLHYAHEQNDPLTGDRLNLVHRDISPQNILVSRHGDVKVTDFGVAKAETQSAKTRTGIIKGKVSYMSPEQCLGDLVDQQTDVFALGIVLYELLTRRRLYREKSDLLVMQRITTDDVAAPSTLNPAVDLELDKIAVRALSRDKASRFATAAELADVLDVWLAKNGHVDARSQLQRWMAAHGRQLRVGPAPEESISQPTWKATADNQAFAVTSEEEEATLAAIEHSDETIATPALGSGNSDDGQTLVVSPDSLNLQLTFEPTMPDEQPAVSAPNVPLPIDSGESNETLVAPPPGPPSYDTGDTDEHAIPLPEIELVPVAGPLVESKGSPAMAAGIGLLVLAAAALGLWFVFSPGEGEAPIVVEPDPDPPAVVDAGAVIATLPVTNPEVPVSDQARAKIKVVTKPPGVMVMRGQTPLGSSPVELEVDDGETVELIAFFEKQAPISRTVKATAKSVTTVSMVARVPVVVRSTPKGATVIINEEDWGQTPKERGVFVEPGTDVRVSLALNGYQDYERTLTAIPGKPLVIDAKLSKVSSSQRRAPKRTFGTVQVNSRPWAHVIIDGSPAGPSPTKARRVKTGRHTIKVHNRDLGFSKTLVVSVKKDQALSVGFVFEKKGAGWRFSKHFIR